MLRPAQPARAAPDSRRWRCAQADARAKEAKLKAAQAGGFGDVSIAAQLEEQRNSMIAMAQEQAKSTAEALQRRIADAAAAVEEERAMEKVRKAKQEAVRIEFEKRKEAQRQHTAMKRTEAVEAQLERERIKALNYEEQQKEKESKMYKYAEADKIREAEAVKRRRALKRRSLAFARKHERKLERIKAENIKKEEDRLVMAEVTAVKTEASEKVRMERVKARKEAVMAENRERSELAAARLAEKKAEDAQKEVEIAVAAERKAVEVDERVAAQKAKVAAATEVSRAAQREQAARIAKKLHEMELQRTFDMTQLTSAAEAKDLVIVEAQKRREKGFVTRAEESRLVFAEKRDFVDRKQRLEEAARLKREEAVMEKDHYTNEVIKQKREYVELRRQMAIQGIVETRSLFDSAKDPRPATAPPTKVEVRAEELRQTQLELSSTPASQGAYSTRGVLSVAAPSKSNGWIGEVESSVMVHPRDDDSWLRPESAASVFSNNSMPEMRGKGRRNRVAKQGGGAVVGRRKLQALEADERAMKEVVGRVRSKASIGCVHCTPPQTFLHCFPLNVAALCCSEGWRLYAPGMHVGLNCETKQNVIEKTAFCNGRFMLDKYTELGDGSTLQVYA